MTQAEQLFKKIDDRFTGRRAEIRKAREALPHDDPTLFALENELLELQIRFRTDYLLISPPEKPLGRFFFWKVKFKAFFYRHGLLKYT